MNKQLSYSLLDQVVVSGSTFMSGILIARMMGPEAFGGYTLANGVFVTLISLQQALLLAPLMVFGASKKEDTGHYLYATAVTHRALSAVSAIVVATVAFVLLLLDIDERISAALFGAAALVFPAQMYDFWRQVAIARGRLQILLICDILAKAFLLSMLFALYSIEWQRPFLAAYGSLVLSALIGALVLWNFGRRHLAFTREFGKYWARNWSFGKWDCRNQIILTISAQVPLYVLVAIHGAGQTGIVGAAIQLTGVFHVFLNGVMNNCFPTAVLINEREGLLALRTYAKRLILYLCAPVAAICLVAVAEARQIVQFLYADAFSSGGLGPFRILLAVGVVLAVMRPLDMMLRIRKQMKRRTNASLIELLFVSVAAYPAIAVHGALGAAYILVLGRSLSATVLALLVSRPETSEN